MALDTAPMGRGEAARPGDVAAPAREEKQGWGRGGGEGEAGWAQEPRAAQRQHVPPEHSRVSPSAHPRLSPLPVDSGRRWGLSRDSKHAATPSPAHAIRHVGLGSGVGEAVSAAVGARRGPRRLGQGQGGGGQELRPRAVLGPPGAPGRTGCALAPAEECAGDTRELSPGRVPKR